MLQTRNVEKLSSGFCCHNKDGNAFRITFKNGFSVSLRWGVNNYCENYQKDYAEFMKSKDVEVVVFNPRGDMINLSERDTILENQTPEQIAEIIYKFSKTLV